MFDDGHFFRIKRCKKNVWRNISSHPVSPCRFRFCLVLSRVFVLVLCGLSSCFFSCDKHFLSCDCIMLRFVALSCLLLVVCCGVVFCLCPCSCLYDLALFFACPCPILVVILVFSLFWYLFLFLPLCLSLTLFLVFDTCRRSCPFFRPRVLVP